MLRITFEAHLIHTRLSFCIWSSSSHADSVNLYKYALIALIQNVNIQKNTCNVCWVFCYFSQIHTYSWEVGPSICLFPLSFKVIKSEIHICWNSFDFIIPYFFNIIDRVLIFFFFCNYGRWVIPCLSFQISKCLLSKWYLWHRQGWEWQISANEELRGHRKGWSFGNRKKWHPNGSLGVTGSLKSEACRVGHGKELTSSVIPVFIMHLLCDG